MAVTKRQDAEDRNHKGMDITGTAGGSRRKERRKRERRWEYGQGSHEACGK